MRILVTGGAGYIGSITCRVLLDAGHDVTVLDTLEKGHRWAVDERARLVVGDVGDAAACAEALADVESVLHCAGYIEVAESEREPEKYYENNVTRPQVLLETMRACGVTSLVFSSTAAVYGEPSEIPVTEDAPLRPVNVYGKSKARFEELLDDAEGVWGLRSVRLRYFNVAGAMHEAGLGEAHTPETHIIPLVLGAMAAGVREFEVYGGDYPTPDGTCIRDYIHVLDLGDAHRRALQYLEAGGETAVCNLGNGRGYSN
ncbi:MAG: UDP-glucose 4-epimerase GalE, partial [Coriobacteriales bacterium]